MIDERTVRMLGMLSEASDENQIDNMAARCPGAPFADIVREARG